MMMNFGGRTPYNLGWLLSDGSIEFTKMGTLLGPSDPSKMVDAVLMHPTLADWASMERDGKEKVLVALGGATYRLRSNATVPTNT